MSNESKPAFKPSPEQQAIIDHRKGHLQIIACAGSGKTEAISRRVAALIEDGVDPGAIIAFTFTDRAASGLKARITKRVAQAKGKAFLDRLNPMYVGTIHAYCLRLLQDHVPGFGNYDILDDNRLAGLLSREHKRLELDKIGEKHWAPIFEFLKNADVMENELIDPAKVKNTEFGKCYARYRETLDRYHFLTYGMLITQAVRALETPKVFERVHRRLKYLIVDEYQDVNPAQERLIELLAKPPVNLCVVGDDDQAIYQWRGSDVSNIVDFLKRYKGAKTLPISINRRSRPSIIDTANAFAKSIKGRLKKKMQPHRQASGPEFHCWAALQPEDEAKSIANTIESLAKRGYRYRDIAVLYRSVRTSGPPLIEELKKRGIPFRCAGRTGLFLQPDAIVLGKTYAWLCGNEWKSNRYGDSEAVDFKALVAEYAEIFNAGTDIPGLIGLLKAWKAVVDAGDQQASLVRDYYRLLRTICVHDLDLNDPEQAARMGTLARFSQILADFEHVTRRARYVDENGTREYRGGQDRGVFFYRKLFNFLQYYSLDAYEDFGGEDTFDLDAVDLLTIHQAKGLEWPVVFVPCLVHGRFPSKRTGEQQSWLIPESIFTDEIQKRYEGSENDERRLFYVAMTRARDMLYLSRFERMKRAFRPSPFFLEVAGGELPVSKKALALPERFSPPGDEAVEPPVLSFSELALYEACPLRYRLSGSLGFQPQLAAELGYGKAIHHVLRRLADITRERKALPTQAEIDRLFQDDFYMPFANKPAFEQILAKSQRLVGRYVADYSDDLLRVWETERPFELHLEHGIVNGRADVILDNEGGVINRLALVDYKTATDAASEDVFAFQLAIYAAAGRGEGLDVRAAYLHALADGTRNTVAVHDHAAQAAVMRANALIQDVVRRSFPPKPAKDKCTACDVRAICKHAQCGAREF